METSIMVDCGGGWKLKLKAEGYTTMSLVKEGIQQVIGIPTERQSLSHGSGQVLHDDEPIYGGVNAVFLTVEPLPAGTKLRISVRCRYPANADYEEGFEVEETDTVMELKRRIVGSERFVKMLEEKVTRVAPEEVLAEDLALWRTVDRKMKDDDAVLSTYHVHEGCSIAVAVLAIHRESSDPDGSLAAARDAAEGST